MKSQSSPINFVWAQGLVKVFFFLGICLGQEEMRVRSFIRKERAPALTKTEELYVIQGQLRDSLTGEALAGATVTIVGTNLGTLTGLDGSFRLSVSPTEIQDKKIQFQYLGYLPREVTVEELEKTSTFYLSSGAISLKEIQIISQVANTLTSPLTISKIDLKNLGEIRGSQEYTEALRFTPSIYASREGGGWGDSRLNLRGFEQENIAILINGIPVNDMENARIYWSNWATLSDLTQEIQVQKGIGNARIAIPSIGGTVNITTFPPQAEKQFSFYAENSNVYHARLGFTYHSGLSPKGWALTLGGQRVVGAGYIAGTDLSVWGYYAALSKNLAANHRLVLQGLGSPQWHYQRFTYLTQKDMDKGTSPFFNSDYGYLDGQRYANFRNFYHKPLISLSHYWNLSDRSLLVTVAYVSFGRGGGSGLLSTPNWDLKVRWDIDSLKQPGLRAYRLPRRSDGLIDWEKVRSDNTSQVDTLILPNGQKVVGKLANLIHRNSVNSHNWYGAISNFQHQGKNIEINTGIDIRYYYAFHYREVKDLFGADFWLDTFDVNAGWRLTRVGDRVNYDYDSRITWFGGYLQTQYNLGPITLLAVGTLAQTNYQRIENFRYRKENADRVSKNIGILSYNVKGGASFRITENLLFYLNSGYYTRPPFFQFVFINDRGGNEIAQNYDVEKITQFEGGIRFESPIFSTQLNGYHILWKDKVLMSPPLSLPDGSFTQVRLNGLNALHQGIEAEIGIQPLPWLRLVGIGSLGRWQWQNDVQGIVRDNNQQIVDTLDLYIKDLPVGSAPQTQLSGILRIQPEPHWHLLLTYSYYDRFWATFDPEKRTNPNDRQNPWRMPAYALVDVGAGYEFPAAPYMKVRFYLNIHNLLDTRYLVTAVDGKTHTQSDAQFFYGFGRTYNVGMMLSFK
ncbi:MAG: TonB-dependent receptor [Bacteroidia bacterium]